uniref:Transcription factor grauzone n=1 Tax=Anopheles farauti TaxID=69004 RepID=A0A182QTW8_9DIPT
MKKTNDIRLSEKCRLCLEKIGRRKGSSIMDDNFKQMLENVFTFTISNELHMPILVCLRCFSTVRDFHDFSKIVESNQEVLLQECVQHEDNDSEDTANEVLGIESVNTKNSMVSPTQTTIFLKQDCTDVLLELKNEAGSTSEAETTDEIDVSQDDTTDGREKRNTVGKDKPESEQELHENDRIIQEYFTMSCELCPHGSVRQFDRFLSLQNHYRKEHQCRGYVRCCGKQFFRRFRAMEHIASHRGMIRCVLCDKQFKSKSYLLNHTATVHREVQENRPYACDVCQRTFQTEKQLDKHRPNHETTECKLCGKRVQARYIKKHVSEIHEGARKWYMCDLCGKNYSSRMVLGKHIRQQHEGEDTIEKVQCTYCGKQLNGKYNLQKHIRCMHLEPGNVYRCDVCAHESPNSIALENHKKRVHAGENFTCEECGKRFKRKIYLKEHMAAFHTLKPLYSCEYCSATFNSKANYYNHRKTRHPDEWRALKDEKGESEGRSREELSSI